MWVHRKIGKLFPIKFIFIIFINFFAILPRLITFNYHFVMKKSLTKTLSRELFISQRQCLLYLFCFITSYWKYNQLVYLYINIKKWFRSGNVCSLENKKDAFRSTCSSHFKFTFFLLHLNSNFHIRVKDTHWSDFELHLNNIIVERSFINNFWLELFIHRGETMLKQLKYHSWVQYRNNFFPY